MLNKEEEVSCFYFSFEVLSLFGPCLLQSTHITVQTRTELLVVIACYFATMFKTLPLFLSPICIVIQLYLTQYIITAQKRLQESNRCR